jgi:hypothetical protein
MDEQAQALVNFGTALARELGAEGRYDHEHRYWFEITKIPGAPGVTLACDCRQGNGYVPGKAEIRTVLPNYRGTYFSGKRPVIGVSMSRPAAAVAADVKRRLLQAAIGATAAMRSTIEQHVAREYAERAACTKLGITPQNGGTRGGRYLDLAGSASAYVDVRDGADVKIEIRGCPVELALKVVALLEAHAAAAGSEAA